MGKKKAEAPSNPSHIGYGMSLQIGLRLRHSPNCDTHDSPSDEKARAAGS
jgi:hypothetical protein